MSHFYNYFCRDVYVGITFLFWVFILYSGHSCLTFIYFPQALRNFQLEVHVDPKYHPKIIGRKGIIIDKIRKEHEVQIQVPSTKSGGDDDVITLTGYERNCEAAKDEIDRMVKELVSGGYAPDNPWEG